MEEVKKYIASQSYEKAKNCAFDYTVYFPHLIPSKKSTNKLYCRLTRSLINKTPKQAQEHTQGKHYLKRKAMCKSNLDHVMTPGDL
jgi:hypothetical protein